MRTLDDTCPDCPDCKVLLETICVEGDFFVLSPECPEARLLGCPECHRVFWVKLKRGVQNDVCPYRSCQRT